MKDSQEIEKHLEALLQCFQSSNVDLLNKSKFGLRHRGNGKSIVEQAQSVSSLVLSRQSLSRQHRIQAPSTQMQVVEIESDREDLPHKRASTYDKPAKLLSGYANDLKKGTIQKIQGVVQVTAKACKSLPKKIIQFRHSLGTPKRFFIKLYLLTTYGMAVGAASSSSTGIFTQDPSSTGLLVPSQADSSPTTPWYKTDAFGWAWGTVVGLVAFCGGTYIYCVCTQPADTQPVVLPPTTVPETAEEKKARILGEMRTYAIKYFGLVHQNLPFIPRDVANIIASYVGDFIVDAKQKFEFDLDNLSEMDLINVATQFFHELQLAPREHIVHVHLDSESELSTTTDLKLANSLDAPGFPIAGSPILRQFSIHTTSPDTPHLELTRQNDTATIELAIRPR